MARGAASGGRAREGGDAATRSDGSSGGDGAKATGRSSEWAAAGGAERGSAMRLKPPRPQGQGRRPSGRNRRAAEGKQKRATGQPRARQPARATLHPARGGSTQRSRRQGPSGNERQAAATPRDAGARTDDLGIENRAPAWGSTGRNGEKRPRVVGRRRGRSHGKTTGESQEERRMKIPGGTGRKKEASEQRAAPQWQAHGGEGTCQDRPPRRRKAATATRRRRPRVDASCGDQEQRAAGKTRQHRVSTHRIARVGGPHED